MKHRIPGPWAIAVLSLCVCLLRMVSARATTIVFFNPSQPVSVVASNITSGALSSSGYRFEYTTDGYWAAVPGGEPTGRFFSVFWPGGVQAQAITVGSDVGKGANITIRRVDGQPFGLRSFTGKLLANTGGAGGAFEIMPMLNGEDALPDPLLFDASGYGGQSFHYTPALSGYDSYVIHLYVDWALVGLTTVDSLPLLPAALAVSPTATNACRLSWSADAVGYVLEQSPQPAVGNWATVTNLAQMLGPDIQVTVPFSGSARFFRLKAAN
ncbi:MAG: hypothetical protein H7A46_20215 [Verrucomicrobiales bacterium]|nr:hypothetical protein [Verrucomicrobiales bacterium]